MPRRAAALIGVKEVDEELRRLFGPEGDAEINKLLRKVIRQEVKDIILPQVRVLTPKKTGQLVSETRVRAARRTRKFFGTTVGYRDEMYTGDTFYGGMLEFGTKDRYTKTGAFRGRVPEFKFLRGPLYQNQNIIRNRVKKKLLEFIRKANSKVPNIP